MSNFSWAFNNPFFSLSSFFYRPRVFPTKLLQTLMKWYRLLISLNFYPWIHLFNIFVAKWEIHTKHFPEYQRTMIIPRKSTLCAWDVAQWFSICLACVNTWVQFPALPKQVAEPLQKSQNKEEGRRWGREKALCD